MSARSIARVATALAMACAVASGSAAPAFAAGSGDAQSARAAGMPWCGKVLWTGAKVPTASLKRKLETVERVVGDVDIATDAATVVLMFVSGGVAVPAAVVKGVAKLGLRMIIRVVKRLQADLAKVNRRKAGVRLTLKCIAGAVPYPSFSIYT